LAIILTLFLPLDFAMSKDPPIRWYNFDGQAPWYLCPSIPFPLEATVVTAFDKVYHYYGSEDKRSIPGVVHFPDTGTWSQVGCWIKLECPVSSLCDHWDRIGSLQLVLNPLDDPVDWEYLEITRYITPYRINMCTYVDVSPLAHLLTGEQTLVSHVSTWVGPGHTDGEGWRVTAKFVFYPGPDGAADEVINIWGRRSIYVGDLDPAHNVDSQIDPVTVDLSPYTTKVYAHVFATGHGFGNTFNCAEFCQMRQDVYVNGTRYSFNPWRNDCEHNPNSPQPGTWKYDRNGWCPGAPVIDYFIDVTDDVVIGGSNLIDYDIRLNDGSEYENLESGSPSEVISLKLYVYKSRPDVPLLQNGLLIIALLAGITLLTLNRKYSGDQETG
jgi:hypothetical protein